ncbi:MAG: hypothetical protein PF518_19915, partial [Spirochaetaceae bacterium]|nr:hypothetical protein [Spirochaetaceae bacterium]
MKNKQVILLILILTLSNISIYSESDKEIAQLYMDEAFYHYSQENFTKAEELLQKSLGFSDQIPEVWYLSGLISEGQGNRLKSIDLYKKSIYLSDVYKEYFYDLYYRYINLLNITDNHKDVIDFYRENRKVLENDDD